MYNFVLVNEKTFSLNGGNFPRKYAVKQNKDGTFKIYDIETRLLLFSNIPLNQILVNGEPILNIEPLRDVLYNFYCNCSGGGTEPTQEGIFDQTFDPTFE